MDLFNVNVVMPGFVGPVEQDNETGDPVHAIIIQACELAKNKRFSAAIELLLKAIDEHPQRIVLRCLLTQVYLDARRVPEARAMILRLRDLGYTNPEFSAMLGAVLARQRQFKEAILCYREALVQGVSPGEWQIALAESLLRVGRLAEAEKILNERKETVEQERSRLFLNLSMIRLQQERYQEAVNFALEALRSKPAKIRTFYQMGLALMRMGEREGAIRAFKEYARLAPQRVAPYHWLELLTREAGDDEEADAFNLKAREMLENRRLLRVERLRN